MQDLLARIFIVALFVFYAAIALVFVGAGLRTWVWRPIRRKFSAQQPARSYRAIKSTRGERSPS